MKALLINVDCKFNLAIRKMYTYYTSLDYEVEMMDLHLKGYPHNKKVTIDASEYDFVCVSNVFEINAYRVVIEGCNDVAYGGVGSRNSSEMLPADIENCEPFYFDDEDTSWGFLTRGCVNKCYFCKVPAHEGKLRFYKNIADVAKHRKVRLMDNNILAYEGHKDIFRQIIDMDLKVDFNQGLDFRRVDDENLYLLSQMNYMGEYFFSFDDWAYRRTWDEKIQLIKRFIDKPWKIKLFVYINPDMPLLDTVNRIEWCREHECLPYIMRDASCYESEHKDFYTDLAAYCNQPGFFKKMDFKEFLNRRHKNPERIAESWRKWNE